MPKKTEWILVGLLVLVAVSLFLTLKPVVINGAAMEPSYKNGDKYLVNKLSYLILKPQQGDVVTFHYTQNPQYLGIARIIALPGEKIKIQNGKVFINGVFLQENYLQPTITTTVSSRRGIENINDSIGKIVDVNSPKVLEEGHCQ